MVNSDAEVWHELVYYLERQLTLDEWIELDEAMSAVFERMGIPQMGFAGPIPGLGEME